MIRIQRGLSIGLVASVLAPGVAYAVDVPAVPPVPTVPSTPVVPLPSPPVPLPAPTAAPSLPQPPAPLPATGSGDRATGGGGGGGGGGGASGGTTGGGGGSAASGASGGGTRTTSGTAGSRTAAAAPAGESQPQRRTREQRIARRERRLRTAVRQRAGCLSRLGRTASRVLALRAGLGPDEPLDRRAVGRRLDLGPIRVGRIERRALRRLRGLDDAGCGAIGGTAGDDGGLTAGELDALSGGSAPGPVSGGDGGAEAAGGGGGAGTGTGTGGDTGGGGGTQTDVVAAAGDVLGQESGRSAEITAPSAPTGTDATPWLVALAIAALLAVSARAIRRELR